MSDTVLDKLRAIPGCGMRFMAQGVTFTHEGALNFAFLHDCRLCAQLLVDSLSLQARREALEEAAQLCWNAEPKECLWAWEAADLVRALVDRGPERRDEGRTS